MQGFKISNPYSLIYVLFPSVVENLKEGEEYMFRTIAVNEVGKSDPSPGTKYILVREPKGNNFI